MASPFSKGTLSNTLLNYEHLILLVITSFYYQIIYSGLYSRWQPEGLCSKAAFICEIA